MYKIRVTATGYYTGLRDVGVVPAGTEFSIADDDLKNYEQHLASGLIELVDSGAPAAVEPAPPPPAPPPSDDAPPQQTQPEPAASEQAQTELVQPESKPEVTFQSKKKKKNQ